MTVFADAWFKSFKLISHINKLLNWVDSQILKTKGKVFILWTAPVGIYSKGMEGES